MTELMLSDVSRISPMTTCALRYFNVAGAHATKQMGQRMPDATHLIKIIAQVITKKETIWPFLEPITPPRWHLHPRLYPCL